MERKKICTACGTQYPLRSEELRLCPICQDDRQYIPETGQAWTTMENLAQHFEVLITPLNDRLFSLKMAPSFAIGQRALLVVAPGGNILWDCIPLLHQPSIDAIRSLGGIKAIAISHPHYYSSMNEWADVFDCPVYIHQKDEQWIMNKGSRICLWSGKQEALWDGITIKNIGGHFHGSSILHVPFLSPQGTILCGDTFYVSPSKKHISVMYSYPNRIPLPIGEVQRIKEHLIPIGFDTLHGFFEYQDIYGHAKPLVDRSLARYLE